MEWEYPERKILYPFSNMEAEGLPEDFAKRLHNSSKKLPLSKETKQACNTIAHMRFYTLHLVESIRRYLDGTGQFCKNSKPTLKWRQSKLLLLGRSR